MRRRAVYKQLGGMDEITPESEEILRNMSVREKRANRRMWRMQSGYTLRVGIEGYFSSLKRIFGDGVRSKNPHCVEHEIRLKVAIYNDMIDMAESNGHTGKRILLPPGGNAGGGSDGTGAAGVCRAAGPGVCRSAGAGPEPGGGSKAAGGDAGGGAGEEPRPGGGSKAAGGDAGGGAGEEPRPGGGSKAAGGDAGGGAGEGLTGAKTEYG